MPGINKTGGRWNEREKADLVGQVVTGALSVREACARHNLSHERIRDWVAAFRRSAVQAFDEHLRQTLASQGIDVGELSAPGFTGSLGDFAITDLIQTLGLSRRDAVITISHDGRETRIWCAAGEIVDAESGKLKGVPALHRALALEHGRVVAEFSPAQGNRTIHTATLPLLLDAARRIDECRVLMQRLGSARYVLSPKVMSAEAAFSAGEAAVLHCFHAPSLVSDALAESEIGDLETLKTISRLVERGYLSSKAEVESSILPVAPLAGAVSTPPVVMSFFTPVLHQRARRSSGSRRGSLGSIAVLAVLGFGWWLLPNGLFESSSAEVQTRPSLRTAVPFASLSPSSGAREAPSGSRTTPKPWFRPESTRGTRPGAGASGGQAEVMCPVERDSFGLPGARSPHELDAPPGPEAPQAPNAAGARGVTSLERDALGAASRSGAALTPGSRGPTRMDSGMPSLVERTPGRSAAHGPSSPEGSSVRGPAPQMQIIEEQRPRMQLVE
jgi:hypothetical protein